MRWVDVDMPLKRGTIEWYQRVMAITMLSWKAFCLLSPFILQISTPILVPMLWCWFILTRNHFALRKAIFKNSFTENRNLLSRYSYIIPIQSLNTPNESFLLPIVGCCSSFKSPVSEYKLPETENLSSQSYRIVMYVLAMIAHAIIELFSGDLHSLLNYIAIAWADISHYGRSHPGTCLLSILYTLIDALHTFGTVNSHIPVYKLQFTHF